MIGVGVIVAVGEAEGLGGTFVGDTVDGRTIGSSVGGSTVHAVTNINKSAGKNILKILIGPIPWKNS